MALGAIPFKEYFASEAIMARVVKFVDTRDLKSLEVHLYAGSTSAPGTRFEFTKKGENS